MIVTQVLDGAEAQRADPGFAQVLRRVFGSPTDSIEEVDRRAQSMLREKQAIVWEGDAATFQFSYVGQAAEAVLGHPRSHWIDQPTFWADVVVHPEDRDEAVAF